LKNYDRQKIRYGSSCEGTMLL